VRPSAAGAAVSTVAQASTATAVRRTLKRTLDRVVRAGIRSPLVDGSRSSRAEVGAEVRRKYHRRFKRARGYRRRVRGIVPRGLTSPVASAHDA
jgi:hypothetical protein